MNEQQTENTALRLTGAIILNFIITIAEVIGGVIGGSLSLLSEALHNFSDGISLIISGVALRIGRKPKTARYTFGKKRAEILAAAINAVVLVVICIFLMVGAYERLANPKIPSGTLMMIIGAVGLLANFGGTMLLRSHSHENLNFRSAYLHLFSDTISSSCVICGGLVIHFWSISWIDPLITVFIALYVLWESYDILEQTTNIIMMAVPASLSIEDVGEAVRRIAGVENIHHTHLWQMSEEDIHFEAHVRVKDMSVSATEHLLQSIETELRRQFKIKHVTIQCEHDRCDSDSLIA